MIRDISMSIKPAQFTPFPSTLQQHLKDTYKEEIPKLKLSKDAVSPGGSINGIQPEEFTSSNIVQAQDSDSRSCLALLVHVDRLYRNTKKSTNHVITLFQRNIWNNKIWIFSNDKAPILIKNFSEVQSKIPESRSYYHDKGNPQKVYSILSRENRIVHLGSEENCSVCKQVLEEKSHPNSSLGVLTPSLDIHYFIQKYFFSSSEKPMQFFHHKIKGREIELEKLIQQQNFKELLPHIWAERDSDYRITWLKNMTTKYPTPILFFELYRFLKLNSKEKSIFSNTYQSITSLEIGNMLAKADAECFVDPSSKALVHLLREIYICPQSMGIAMKLFDLDKAKKPDPKVQIVIYQGVHKYLKQLLRRVPSLPSPIWLSTNLKSQVQEDQLKEWSSIRANYFTKCLSQLEKILGNIK